MVTVRETAQQAALLFDLCKRVYADLRAEDAEANIDPNIIADALTRSNIEFATRLPVVVRVMATRRLYHEAALLNYLSYQGNNSVESIARRTPKFDELSDEERTDIKIQAQAIYNAQYTWFVAIEEAKIGNPRGYKRDLRERQIKAKLLAEERQQLDVNEEKSKMAMREVHEEKLAVRNDNIQHLKQWLRDSKQFDNINAEVTRLSTPLVGNTQQLGARVEEWAPVGTVRVFH
jgi:hypothetical protein